MSGRRVVLAMSGGVDSSASAVLLRKQGYEVIGLFMRTGTHTDEIDHRPDNKKGCCSAIDANDARRVADKLDLPFFVLATQNPIEMEGTYPLPEAQLDRFLFKVNVGFPSSGELVEIHVNSNAAVPTTRTSITMPFRKNLGFNGEPPG